MRLATQGMHTQPDSGQYSLFDVGPRCLFRRGP